MRDLPTALPALATIEALSFSAGGIEDEKSLACRACVLLGTGQEGCTKALAASAPVYQHLHEIAAVGLIVWLGEDDADRTNDTVAILSDEEQALVLCYSSGNILPVGYGSGVGYWPHEAD